MGLSVHERLGFVTVERWRQWMPSQCSWVPLPIVADSRHYARMTDAAPWLQPERADRYIRAVLVQRS
jgi:hypothetical protein